MKQRKALDVEVQYVDQGHVSEKVTASVEQLAKKEDARESSSVTHLIQK